MQNTRAASAQPPQLQRHSKRQKVSQACTECRSRKTKCDGERPVCGPCLKRYGREAVCRLRLNTDQELALFREEIARLNDKVHNLEGRKDDGIVGAELSGRQRNRRTATRSEPKSPSSSTQEDVDPMVGEISHQSLTGQTFFGASSASGFARQVQHALDPENVTEAPTSTIAFEDNAQSSKSYQDNSDNLIIATIDLPSRSTADHLFDIYWSITYPLYPFLDQEETKDNYLGLWQDGNTITVQRSFLCQINVIFAMAAQLDEEEAPENRVATSRIYLVRAKRQLTSELWEHASLQAVQNFLVLGQYLQSTTKGYQCWMVVGHAIRMAQNLGLHLRETSERIGSPRRQQLFRKVWHGCIMMDRIVSLTFGRPTMIDGKTASMVPLPLNLDDAHLTHEPVAEVAQNNHRPMMISFYIETLKLYELLHEILDKLYHSTEETRDSNSLPTRFLDSEKLADLLNLDQNLNTWFENLPAHLKTDESQAFGTMFIRQANILYSRYLHVRILLYRPSLARFIAIQNATRLDQTKKQATLYEALLLRSSSLCVETAISAIDTIDKHLPKSVESVGSLPAWWYNVLYVYTAAVVLIAAARCPALQSEISQRLILARFETAILIVRRYRIYSSNVQRSIAALEALFAQIPDQKKEFHPPQSDGNATNDGDWNSPEDYTDNFHGQFVSQNEQFERLQEQNFQRHPGRSQIGGESWSSAYNPSTSISHPINQPEDPQIGMAFDPAYLNVPIDMNDFSWLNSLPFNC